MLWGMTNALYEPEQLLSVAEIAMLLGCSAPTVRRWIHEGHLTARKIAPGRAGLVRIPRSAVDELLGGDAAA
jgi:excisionase family DNA binding protein